jgi:Gnt-I system low-affinity gluconate transporter
MLADYFKEAGLGIFAVAFIVAALVRMLQGSATVAMITAAGVTASVLTGDASAIHKALLVIAIASGASILSHVNDSGFWLVSKYLGMTEKQTFKSWTVMTTIIAVVGITTVGILSLFI